MLLEDLKLNMHTARVNRQLKAQSKNDVASTTDPGANTTATATASTSTTGPTKHRVFRDSAPWAEFRSWRKARPFVGSVFMILSGVELFFSSQLDLGNIKVQVGVEGLQSTIIPVIMVTLGILTMFNPVHRIFYGVIGLVVAVYALVGLNLGGFFVGMLLGSIGGILIVSWMPKKVASTNEETDSESGTMRETSLERRSTTAEPRPLVHSR